MGPNPCYNWKERHTSNPNLETRTLTLNQTPNPRNITMMSDNFKIIRYNETERLNESGSNWTFWKTRIMPYLKGSKLWPYIDGTILKPDTTENWQVGQVGGSQCASPLHHLDEYCPKCPGQTRLLIHESSMGQPLEPLHAGRPYRTDRKSVV